MYMLIICALGAASQDVFLSGKGIRAQLDPQINEYVEVKDLEQLPEIYRLTLENLLLR